MTHFRRHLSAFAILLGLFALLAANPCQAARGPLETLPYGQRTDAFRRLLFELQFKPLESFDDLHVTPSEALLIVLGDPRCLSKLHFPQGLRAFVEQGGAVLIATDYETNGEAGEMLGRLTGFTVTGEKLVCHSAHAEKNYDGSPYCPFVEPLADSPALQNSTTILGALAALVGVGTRPDLFRSPQAENDQQHLRVATNAPSRLTLYGRGWWLPSGIHRLAELPSECEPEAEIPQRFSERGITILYGKPFAPKRDVFKTEPTQRGRPLFAVGGTVGKGRVLVVADHSLFINRMMLPRDNDNLEFTANCLHWLRGGISTPSEAIRTLNRADALEQLTGQRTKVLLWDDGRIRRDLEVPLTKGPLKPSWDMEPAIVAALNKTIVKLEDQDYFNRTLLDNLDEWAGGRESLKRCLVYLLTLAAVMLLGYRFLWRSRFHAEPSALALADAWNAHEAKAAKRKQRRAARGNRA